MMKQFFALCLAVVSATAEPSDAAIAAYYKAQNALSAARSDHAALMENIRRAVDESVGRQINAVGAVNAAMAELQKQCSGNIDDAALKEGVVKCLSRETEKGKK